MSAQDVCEKLVNQVKSSNLNFVVRETPYSVFITLRKSFIKTTENDSDDLELVQDGNENNLQNNYDELKRKYEDLENKYDELSDDFKNMKIKMHKENYEKNKLLNKILEK